MAEVKINRITNANVYLEGVGLLGQAEECNMPEIKFKAAEHKALGMVGTAEFTSGIDKMETKIKWNSFYKETLSKLANPYKTVKIQIRGSLQEWESANMTGETQITAYLRVSVANFPGASFKQHDNVEMESQFKVYYYKLEIGDQEIVEVDVLANIHKQDGVDLLADYRANTGT
jgi:P2 family phage contractile tail tube protein